MSDKVLATFVIYSDIDKFSNKLLNALSAVLRIGASYIMTRARNYVPVRTGRLRDSIRVEEIDEFHYIIAPHTHYAKYVELGTIKMRPRPYMMPAANDGIKWLEYAVNKLKS